MAALAGGPSVSPRSHPSPDWYWPEDVFASTRRLRTLSALAFDTLAYARRMEAVGFSRDQAEAMADKQAKIIDERLATKADLEAFRIAAKADLEALRIATKADLEALRIGTKADMAEQKAEILKWIMGTIGIQTVVIIGAVLALVRVVQH
jgi:hypothetical protein